METLKPKRTPAPTMGRRQLTVEALRRDWSSRVPSVDTLLPSFISTKSLSRDDIVEQSKIICKDYVHEKMKSAGLVSKKLKFSSTVKSDTSLEFIAIGVELEKMYPKIYRDLSRKLNTTMRNETTVDKTLTSVLEHLFNEGEITWGKIVAMFALAAQFAIECIQQGHSEFVQVVVDCVGYFVTAYLTEWIISEGGWVTIIHAFRRPRDTNVLRLVTLVGTLVGLLATIAATMRIR